MKALLALALFSSAVRAQTTAVRPLSPSLSSSFAAPAPVALAQGAITLSIAPSLSFAPALTASAPSPVAVPVLAAALITARTPAASSDERPKAPGTARAAQTLAQSSSEFASLVADLTGDDREKSEAAAVSLKALKDAHLNADTDGRKTKILDLKPMQIPAGMIEVQAKADDIRALKKKEADDWLRERSVPVVEDYKGRKRPVDHHHEARAAWEAGLDEIYTHRYLDDELHAQLKALPRDKFYAVTRAMGLLYDRDQFGVGPHDPNHLPETVRSMADDPFRSVAWQVRKRGGYDKTSIPFAEFGWAAYFREHVKTYPTRADFEKAVVEALKIAHDAAARDLPGWKPR